jgi:LEA14-like dessication related protein
MEGRDKTREIGAALFILLLLAGCAGLGKPLKAPEIRFAGIQVEKIDLFETVMQLKLRVLNGNDVALDLKGLECELALNDKAVASGVSGTRVTIPAFGSDTVSVTVYSSVLNIASSIMRFAQKEAAGKGAPPLNYRLKGRLHLEGGALVPTILPFDATGELSVEQLFGRPRG